MRVIGIGTGRCGTMSLALLLGGGRDCTVSHEKNARTEALPWEFDPERARAKLEKLVGLPGVLSGDVALYYLNYVEFFLERVPDLRVVHIYREKESVVRSFLEKTAGRNHWMPNDPAARPDPVWDKCFPKYPDAASKAEAVARYYDEYILAVARLMTKWADRILSCNVAHLNNVHQQSLLFDFLEVPEASRRFGAPHANRMIDDGRERLRVAAAELDSTIPVGAGVILVDQDEWREHVLPGRRVWPFMENEGRYWGPPADDRTAIDALEHLRGRGAEFMVIARPAFWWLDHYAGLRRHLETTGRRLQSTEWSVVFDLTP
jgi:hypothetical protein